MSRSPSLTHKAVGDIVPLWYDWSEELLKFCPGDTITESHWSVDLGTATVSGNPYFPTINGPITQCFVQDGAANETTIINNSILCYPSGVKLVRRFPVLVIEGPFEPPAVPIIMLPDGLKNITELEGFIGAMPGNTIWVDTTTAYPNGTLYVCVPQNSAWVVDGLNVVQGQLVKWVEWHIADGATGVPMSRVLHATAPARIDGGDSADLTADRTFSVDVGTSADTVAAGDDVRFTQINGAGAPVMPLAEGWVLRASVSTAYGLYPPSSILAEDSDTFRHRTLQVDSTGKILGYDNAYRFTGQTGVLHTISIAESEWQGDGSVYPADGNHNHIATVEVTILCVQQDFTAKRQVHEAIIYKLGTGVNWAIGYDGGTRNSALDIPSGLTPYVSFNLTLSGTHNGTLELGIEPTGGADPKSDILVFLKVRGGGRVAA